MEQMRIENKQVWIREGEDKAKKVQGNKGKALVEWSLSDGLRLFCLLSTTLIFHVTISLFTGLYLQLPRKYPSLIYIYIFSFFLFLCSH